MFWGAMMSGLNLFGRSHLEFGVEDSWLTRALNGMSELNPKPLSRNSRCLGFICSVKSSRRVWDSSLADKSWLDP